MFEPGDTVTFFLDPSGEELTVVFSGWHRTQVTTADGVDISHATELLTFVPANVSGPVRTYR
jgi:hypothetical protein